MPARTTVPLSEKKEENPMYSILDEIDREIPQPVSQKYGENALCLAYGCVLLEQPVGGRYGYRAVNLTTGSAETLARKNAPITTEGMNKLIAKLRLSSVGGPGRYEVDRPPHDKLDRDRLTEILNHIFENVLPEHGFARRPGQIRLADELLHSLCKRDLILSEAEVGSGKTHAYLIAAALVKRSRVNDFWLPMSWPGQGYAESAYMPVVVSTSSIALQNAIARDYIPQISRILQQHGIIREPLTYVIRKGREHFACEKKLRAFHADADRETKKLLRPLLAGNVIDLGELDNLTPYIKRRICVGGRCGRDCPCFSECHYQDYLSHAQTGHADFQICNHQYLLADTVRRAGGQPSLIPHYQAVIIDEGHKFLDAARQIYSVSFSSHTLPNIATDLRSFAYRKGGRDIQAQADSLAEQSANCIHF